MLYKLQIKEILIHEILQPSAGWNVCVNIDGSEKGPAGSAKSKSVAASEEALRLEPIKIGRHPVFGAKDIVAEHPVLGTFVVKVVGISSEQPEQQLYGALGQLVRTMNTLDGTVTYVIAAPADAEWIGQLRRIPRAVRRALHVKLWAISKTGASEVLDEEADSDEST